MNKLWLERLRPCPSCNQPHHFVYVIEPTPSRTYRAECPVTKELFEFSACSAVEFPYGPVPDADAKVVPAVAMD